MKMVKRTVIVIALVSCLASTTSADYETEYYGPFYPVDVTIIKNIGEKIDGKQGVLWPYRYEELTICTIPIKMRVGMFVQVKDCKKKKIVLEQVDCGDIGKGAIDYPCYLGCVDFDVRANFRTKLGFSLHKNGDVIDEWSAYYDGDDTVPGDGDWHGVKLCVKAWKTRIYKAAPGDEVSVGSVEITVKPDV
jgi:hypothetical protein